MEHIRIIILCFGWPFTVSFGLAWALPLAFAGQKEAERKKGDVTFVLLDWILILLDCIPVFWLFRAIPEAPSAYRAVREAWKNEASIRTMFWLFSVSLVVTIGSYFLPS